jgi:hypothetical protein
LDTTAELKQAIKDNVKLVVSFQGAQEFVLVEKESVPASETVKKVEMVTLPPPTVSVKGSFVEETSASASPTANETAAVKETATLKETPAVKESATPKETPAVKEPATTKETPVNNTPKSETSTIQEDYSALRTKLDPILKDLFSTLATVPKTFLPKLMGELSTNLASVGDWSVRVEEPKSDTAETKRGGRNFYTKDRHWGIECDICSKRSFPGNRHRCNNCPGSFDVCDECFPNLEHEQSHSFETIGNGKDVWKGVVCDGCDKEILNKRFKCQTCPDYDLCSSCHSKFTTDQLKHPADHIFKDMGKRWEEMSAKMAQLNDMGFTRPFVNRTVLRKTDGDVSRAVHILTSGVWF